jgi:formylglycine-generating enzyme required for sulfatase activity
VSDPLVGRTIGGVTLQAKIGSGGMGAVYAGLDEQAGSERVAIKLLSVTSHEAILARFDREAKIGRALEHPLLVRVARNGESGDYRFLVMELVEGEDLAHVMRREGPFPWGTTAVIGRDVALALAALHEQGIVHRDLKPQNVLLDGHGRIKLADFGLASWRSAAMDETIGPEGPGASLTVTGDAFGTPVYMAPEQYRDAKSATPRSDLYSLGVLLFEALAGRPPFRASSPHDLARLHSQVAPPSLDALASDAPPELRTLIARLLEKRMEDRPSTAREVAGQLKDIGAHGQTRALPLQPPPGTQVKVWDPAISAGDAPTMDHLGRRRVRWLLIAAPLLLLLAAGLGWGLWTLPGVRLALASNEERARYEAVERARANVTNDKQSLLDAIDTYLRDYGQDGLLAEDVRRLQRTPLPLRENIFLLPIDGAEMVRVISGDYPVGHEDGDGQALSEARSVPIAGFLIDRREVSNARYERFLAEWQAAGSVHQCGSAEADHAAPLEVRKYSPEPGGPAVGVSPYDALEYARFYGRRLPSEEEWEVAASWDAREAKAQPYPWGAREPNRLEHRYFANLGFADYGQVIDDEFVLQCTTPGSLFEFDVSGLGLYFVAGNAAEWCQGRVPLPGRQPLRGGSILTDDSRAALLAARREHDPAQSPPPDAGFRTALPFEGSE